ncbi:hypothetical protein AALP_AA7G125500 [Arabis alpina]|uniref:Uncharacterized protein n=1 Tax=Arabis alpina TaxID=50452 RepID=A0A087GHM1_ARAAL|nr:hypothetical protein AALP_AA7G125500 [Arabis alpina]
MIIVLQGHSPFTASTVLDRDISALYKALRRALRLELDQNKLCNLAICLMRMGRIQEAKSLLNDSGTKKSWADMADEEEEEKRLEAELKTAEL